jgi:hypothetical protein
MHGRHSTRCGYRLHRRLGLTDGMRDLAKATSCDTASREDSARRLRKHGWWLRRHTMYTELLRTVQDWMHHDSHPPGVPTAITCGDTHQVCHDAHYQKLIRHHIPHCQVSHGKTCSSCAHNGESHVAHMGVVRYTSRSRISCRTCIGHATSPNLSTSSPHPPNATRFAAQYLCAHLSSGLVVTAGSVRLEDTSEAGAGSTRNSIT